MNIQKQTLFDIYGDKGLPTDLVSINIFRIIIATIGIFLNASVVYVTVKAKTLKSPCHFLLAFECFSNSIFQLHSWLSLTVILIPGHQFIPIKLCCQQLILIFVFAFALSFTSAFLVSFDRLIITKRLYLIPMICTSFICPLIIIWAIYQIVNTASENTQVICAPHECMWGWASDLTYFIFSAINFLTVVNYIIVWIALKWHAIKNQNQASFEWTHRILKTLAVLMVLNLIGHSMNSIARMTVPRLDLDITQSTIVTHSLSQEYRQAFNKNSTKVTIGGGTANNVKINTKINIQNNNGLLFDIYGEKGLPIELISVNVLRTIIATIGIFFNVSLVYVTLKSKILNSPCHLLIAFDCFVSSFYQLGSWVSITVLFNPGHQFIPIRPCCLQILPPFQVGFTSSFTAIYLISLDRLISV
ncbi:G_PROTEIN_RECEP_F1_2 domain-containing protein [Meloidogyne graminicola]|uniref:G_PROTEIN_RECEP_F1_2 domain-containing protein n=1 Tax=Meloidogyne graminicola TaxID=189291 RepID=A0A8S9ZAX9_9BILA|nr:G_PROTEIN_RECEP_F1_2 domain-containing protein [Meloidogyne graminicola]